MSRLAGIAVLVLGLLAATQAAGWNTTANARQASLMVFGDGTTSEKGQHP